MIPVVTPDEARALDAAAGVSVEVLVERAGWAVASQALALLGGAYGRRVVVVAGRGHNGDDGRVAARLLRRRGVQVVEVDATAPPPSLPPCDLVVDAAFGTGFRGEWAAPATDAPVLAVDVPSGVDALTGVAGDGAWRAVRTVTFAGLKPGLLLGPGAVLAGEVVVAEIGLDAATEARAWVVEAGDVTAWLPQRPREAHKWHHATWIVAGSEHMAGAALLATRGAQRAGASYVRLSMPGVPTGAVVAPAESVRMPLPATGWAADVLDGCERIRSLVLGPGLGRAGDADVRRVVEEAEVPVVVDGDGLAALGRIGARLPPTTVLTPHDGEYERLTGAGPGADRLAAARRLAAEAGCTVLLKGPTTVVAAPDGSVLLTTTGDARLATAGTGDVLAGVIAALLAQGLAPTAAAAAGAWLHGEAARRLAGRGMVAGDLPECLPSVLDRLER